LVVRTTKGWVRSDGMITSYAHNAIILLKKNPMIGLYLPLGTRIQQPIAKSLRYQSCHRILALSSKWV
jgi:ribosomal protein L14